MCLLCVPIVGISSLILIPTLQGKYWKYSSADEITNTEGSSVIHPRKHGRKVLISVCKPALYALTTWVRCYLVKAAYYTNVEMRLTEVQRPTQIQTTNSQFATNLKEADLLSCPYCFLRAETMPAEEWEWLFFLYQTWCSYTFLDAQPTPSSTLPEAWRVGNKSALPHTILNV